MALIKGDNKNNTLKGGETNDVLFGFDGIDFLYGNGGNDWLNGGAGIDKLAGGTGNDTYVVDNQYDSIIERPDSGTDTVISSVNWVLAANEENLILTGTKELSGYGNSANNTIIGNATFNKLVGKDGNDILDGRAGIDRLFSGNGDDLLKIRDFNHDVIDGGFGEDVLEIYGANQRFNLSISGRSIVGIEKIKFSGAGHNVLTISPQSIHDKTLTVDGDAGDSVDLTIGGWLDGGIQGDYHLYSQQNTTVKVNTTIGKIAVDEAPTSTYTISDSASAEQVSNVFTSGTEVITIDFGGKAYQILDVYTINLTGFGLEDSLVIALHDGAVSGYGGNYYEGKTGIRIEQSSFTPGDWVKDTVIWKTTATTVMMKSREQILTTIYEGSIIITGLPKGLPDSQFVFV